MHIKLFLLWYKDYLRVALPSANLMSFDWDTIENIVWFQDFPKLGHSLENKKREEDAPFYNDLIQILSDMQVPRQILEALKGYDFGEAVGTLVASVPGRYSGSHLKDYGQLRLQSVVEKFSPISPAMMTVAYQTSSLGSMSKKWAQEFYQCATGTAPSPPSSSSSKKAQSISQLPPMRVIFPSENTVKSCSNGAGGGTICFNSKYWPNFPQSLIRDCISTRKGCLMHCKVIFLLYFLAR